MHKLTLSNLLPKSAESLESEWFIGVVPLEYWPAISWWEELVQFESELNWSGEGDPLQLPRMLCT